MIFGAIVGYTYILAKCYDYIVELGDDSLSCDIGTRTKVLFVFVIAFLAVIALVFDIWLTLLMKSYWDEV